MPEHYQRNVTQVMSWCSTCGRRTMHRVDDRRLGPCLEKHVAAGLSAAQEKRQKQREIEAQQPTLEGL